MNICQLITPSKVAGAERSTMSLCEHLQKGGHRVVLGAKAASPLLEEARAMGLDARALRISGKLNALAPFRVAALAREMKADVIHTQLSTAAWHGSLAARLLGLPVVAHVRALNSPHWYRLATRIIAIAEGVKRHLVVQGVDPAKIDVVYNGVDPARYYLPYPRDEARRRLGLPSESRVVGVVAHLTAKKGHVVFLRAFAELAEKYPDALALFLGDGPERETLRAAVARLRLARRVVFAGFQADVLPYYAAMDFVVLPSTSMEGMGRAFMEGGLLGLPGVGTRLGGVPEVIRDGEGGFVVPPGDAAMLRDRMELLLADAGLRDRMGRAAREYLLDRFTVSAMVAGTLASYERAGVKVDAAIDRHAACQS